MKVLNNEQGQGTVEYILVLVVVVSIAIGVLYQFNTAFARFSENYFGEYLACLLETGELPNLGAEAGTSCDTSFEEFDIRNGRPPKTIASGSSGGRGGGPTGSSSGREKNNSVDGESGGSSSGGGARRSRVAGGAAANDSGGSESSLNSNRGRRGTRRGGKLVSEKKSEDKEKDLKALNASSDFSEGNSQKRRKIPTGLAGELEREKNKKNPVQNAGSIDQKGDESQGRKKKISVKERKPTVKAEEDEPFTIGKFLKYILIAGIIIAIVVFVGGQALQISKEWD